MLGLPTCKRARRIKLIRMKFDYGLFADQEEELASLLKELADNLSRRDNTLLQQIALDAAEAKRAKCLENANN